jgi:hypothetical protein
MTSLITSSVTALPVFLAELLESCPTAGSGVNNWLYAVSKQLHVHMDAEQQFALLKAKTEGCGRVVSVAEIRHQIRCAQARAFQPKDPTAYAAARGTAPRVVSVPRAQTDDPPAPKWPAPDHDAIRQIVAGGWSLYDLWESSPLRYDDEQCHTEEIIDVLFPGNPLLSCGRSILLGCGKMTYKFATRRREIWRGHLARVPLITPTPMRKIRGITLEGNPSEHCRDGVGKRLYQIIEFDFSEYARDGSTLTQWAPMVREWNAAGITVADACAALHLHMANLLPFAAAVSSGGKSIHGWYSCAGRTDSLLRFFMNYAVTLGADHALWKLEQFTRTPDGKRENGARQTCFYLDPGKAPNQ